MRAVCATGVLEAHRWTAPGLAPVQFLVSERSSGGNWCACWLLIEVRRNFALQTRVEGCGAQRARTEKQ